MQLFSYNLHSLLYLSSQLVYLLSIVYLCFILLPSMFYSCYSMSPCFFNMFYCFDDEGLAFLGQDMPKYCVFLLDPRAQVLLAMFMLRSIFLCSLFHVDVSRSTYWLLCYVLLKSFVSFCTFFLFFGPLGRVQIQILRSRPTSMHLGLYQRVWIISFMYVYACLLLCFISMFTYLDLGFAMLCALCVLVLISL